MNDILGSKRIAFLAILVILCGALGGANYYYVQPQTDSIVRSLQTTESNVRNKRNDINDLRSKFTTIQDQLAKYKILESMGFFNTQDRVIARETFSKLQKESGILVMRYRINSSISMKSRYAKEINHVLISSPVQVDIEALDDVDVYRFIQMVREKFPGDISFKQIEIKRVLELSSPLIRQIGNGKPVTMVKAVVNFDWRSLAPEEEINDVTFR